MEIVYFVTFVLVCAFLVAWSLGRSRKKREAAEKLKARTRNKQSNLLETPANYTLSRPNQPWHTRRNPASSGVVRTNAFVARSLGQDPEYDGYSRRDRHHVHDRSAKIKADSHLEEPRMSSIEYKESQAGG